MSPEVNAEQVSVIFMDGVEGPSLYVNNFRVLGPKPWGGAPIVKEWIVERSVLIQDLKRAGLYA